MQSLRSASHGRLAAIARRRTAWNVSTIRAGVLSMLRVIDKISLSKVAAIFTPYGSSNEGN
jgi:hypothetical protein